MAENEMLKCDMCDKEVHYKEIFHFSGIYNQWQSGHIHVCRDCVELYNLDITIDFDKLKQQYENPCKDMVMMSEDKARGRD
jgi:hypothetical protein